MNPRAHIQEPLGRVREAMVNVLDREPGDFSALLLEAAIAELDTLADALEGCLDQQDQHREALDAFFGTCAEIADLLAGSAGGGATP